MLGFSDAIASYGYLLAHGEGVPVDKEDAIRYYKMAIEKGNSDGMLFYGKMLFNSEIKVENNNEWIDYIKLAIDNKNVDAMFFYATLLDKGDRIEKNKMASENGSKEAKEVLDSIIANQE